MKFLTIFALALSTTFGFSLRDNEINTRRLEGRITNGQDADVGEFPYQVGLSMKCSQHRTSWCGGSIIDNEWVLTSAHCIDGATSATIYLGMTNRTFPEVERIVTKKNFIFHSAWNSETLKNDIALIKMQFANYSKTIQPVKLPAISSSYSTFIDEGVLIAGWGVTSDSSKIESDILQWALLNIIPNSECPVAFNATSSLLCVSTLNGVSDCSGDSGGPLVLKSEMIQVGVSSFGFIDSCEKGYPSAYTRITSYLDWIKLKTGISY